MHSFLDAIAAVLVGGIVLLTVLTAITNIQEHAYNTTMQVTVNQISEHVSTVLQKYLSAVGLNVDSATAIVHARKKSFRFRGEYNDIIHEFLIEQGTQDTTTGWWPLSIKSDGITIMGNFYTEEEVKYSYYDIDGNKIAFVGNSIAAGNLPNIRSIRCEQSFVHPGWIYGGQTTTIRNRIVFWKFFKNMYLVE